MSSSSRVVLLSRIVHGLISALFLCCVAVVYVAAWRGKFDVLALAALAALSVEGVLVLLSRGDCPLGPVFQRLGDETPFFALLLPPGAAKLAVPVLAVVTAVGAVVLVVRTV